MQRNINLQATLRPKPRHEHASIFSDTAVFARNVRKSLAPPQRLHLS